MQQFKVLEVLKVHPWSNAHGQNFDFNLSIEDAQGTRGTIQVTAKSSTAYKPGDAFWAVPKGQEHMGIPKFKRVPAPDGPQTPVNRAQSNWNPPQSSGEAPQSHAPAPVAVQVKPKPPMPWKEAALLLNTLATELANTELVCTVFPMIVRGEIENPTKPKATIVFFGKELETAGVQQAAWDQIASLVDRLVRLTDDKHVKALLIATCGVQSRKDLTADNAALFIEALKLNILNEEAKQVPLADDGDVPF